MEGNLSSDVENGDSSQEAVPDPTALVGVLGLRDEHWYSVGSPPASIAQGWKLYVSATPANYVRVLRAVAEVFMDAGFAFKYLRTLEQLMRMNAGLHGFSQIGKCVVAYLHDPDAIPSLVTRLHMVLDHLRHEGPFVPRLPRAWPGGDVFYRYGSFVSASLIVGGEKLTDDRNQPWNILSKMDSNPFADSSSNVGETGPDEMLSILDRYPVTGTVCKSGKGGVFNAFESNGDQSRELVVKIGLRLGQILPDGRDGAHFVQHERSMYELMRVLELSHCLPRIVDFSVEKDATVLILEKLQGENLADWRRCGGSDPVWLRMAMEMIEMIHCRGLVLGDAKTANFVKVDSKLMLVDLESCRLSVHGNNDNFPKTFAVLGAERYSLEEVDLIHFLVSAIYPVGHSDRWADRGRSVDVQDLLLNFVPKDEWELTALNALSRVARAA